MQITIKAKKDFILQEKMHANMISTQTNKLITFGVWDLFHIGHLMFIKKCLNVCEKVYVGVQSDMSVFNQKGYYPTMTQYERCEYLEELYDNIVTFIYDDFDYKKYALEFDCNILALSSDNRGVERFKDIVNYVYSVYYFDYYNNMSSTKIKGILANNVWKPIWESVGYISKDDYAVVGRNIESNKMLADYITKTLKINPSDTVLDYGCGTGVLLKELNCNKIGIDISLPLLEKAQKNTNAVLIKSDTIPVVSGVDHIVCWSVLHYLPNIGHVQSIIDSMKHISNSIIIMELPDIDKMNERIENRKKLGKTLTPQPLYFSKKFFIDNGFKILDNPIATSDNSDYSFSVIYNIE